jgi:hypothetical protein
LVRQIYYLDLKFRQDFIPKIEYTEKRFKTDSNIQRLSNLNTDFNAKKLIVKAQTQNLETMTRRTNFVCRVQYIKFYDHKELEDTFKTLRNGTTTYLT